jgi:hypothetical protein
MAPPMKREAEMRTVLVLAAIVVGGFLVLHVGKAVSAKDPPPHGHSGSVAISLNTMQTYRTITVSPTAVNCGSYRRGVHPNRSNGAMGFPNGTCAVGDRVTQKDPIKITYNGMQGLVFVHAGWAMPNGNEVGTPWKPCSSAGHRVVACTGNNGLPGYDQYTVRNFSMQTQTPARAMQITGNNVCDVNFRPAGGCYASRGNFQREGFYITGPSKVPTTDTAQSWTAWVIWTAMPQGFHHHHE